MGRGADSDPYRRLFETMLDGAVVLDTASGRVVLGNGEAARILGFASADALVGVDPMDLVPEEERQRAAQLLTEGRERDLDRPVEIRLITADKREAWVSARATMIDYQGRRAVLATFRDITHDKARDSALRDADHRYERLFDRMLDGAVVLDIATFKIAWASRVAAAMFGFASPQEAVGEDPLDYIPEEDRNRVVQRIAANLEGSNKTPSEWRIITRDKREIWISASAAEIEYEGRRAVVSTMRDVTEEKARYAALREAEHRYGRLFDGMIDGALVLDIATFKVALANRAAAAMFGFASPEEIIGKNPLDYIAEEDRSRIVQTIATNIEGKHKDSAELQVMTADNRRIWVSATATEVYHEGRAAIITTMRDVTAEKAKDAALRVAEESKMQLIDAASEAIFIIQDGKVAYVNPAGARGAGLSQDDLIGIPFLDMVHPDNRQEVAERYQKLNAGQFFPGLFTAKGVTAQRETKWANIQELPYLWHGRPAVMSLISDVTDRVLAEQALKHEEERLRAIMENAWDGVAIFDRDFRVIFESPSLARMTGYTPEEWTGITPEKFQVHPDDLRPMLGHLESLSSHPGSFIQDVVIRYRHRDGSWRTMEATGRNLLDDPKVRGMVINFRDITERRQAEEALRDSEKRLNRAQEIAHLGSWELDTIDNRLFWSDETFRIFGLQPQEAAPTYEAFLDAVHPDDRAAVDQAYKGSLRNGSSAYEIEHRIVRRSDGAVRFVHERCEHIRNETGQVVRSVGMVHDTTDKVRAEEALKEREALLRAVVENAWDGVAVFDENFRVVFESPSLSKITGYKPVEWEQSLPTQWPVHPDDFPTILRSLDTLKKEPGSVLTNVRMRVQRKDGSWRWMEASAMNLLDDPRLRGIVCNFRDTTERMETEESLRQSEALLRSTQELAMVGGWDFDILRNQAHWTDETYRIHEIPNLPDIDHMAESLKCFPPMDRQVVKDAFQRCVDDGTPFDLVVPFMTFKGNRRWVRTTAKAIREGDRTVRVVGNIADITERKSAEERLLASEERYRKVVETASEAIAVLQDGVIKFANPKTAAVSGYPIAELTQKPFLELVHPDDRQMVADYYVMKQKGRESPSTYQFRFVDKSGRTGWAEANVTLLIWDGRLATLLLMNIITERKMIEEALKDREARYRGLFEGTQTAIEVVSVKTGLVVLANTAAARMFGFAAPDDLIGVNPLQFLTPEDRSRLAERTASEAMGSAHQEAVELQVLTNDGRRIWISGVAAGTDYQGEPALLFSFLDITWRKQAEETLLASEEKYRFLVDNTSDFIWTMDLDLRTTYASPSVERILGFTPEERLLQTAAQQTTPESLSRARKALGEYAAAEQDPQADPHRTLTIEMEYYRKDGSTIWVENQIGGIRDAGGRLVAFHGVSRDVSDRRQAEQALRESEARYRLLAENASDVIWVVDKGLRITYASPSAANLLGYTAEEMLGKSIDGLLSSDSLAAMADLYVNGMVGEGQEPGSLKEQTAEVQLVHKDGATVWVETGAKVVRDLDGRVAGFQGACRDIRRRKEAEAAIKASEERFRTLIEESTDAIAIVGATGRLLYQSPSMTQVSGYRPEEWTGSPVDEWFLHPDDMPAVAAAYAQVLNEPNATMSGLNARFKHADGTWHTLQATVRNLLHDPKVNGLVINYRDVTERVRSQEALLASETNYKRLFEATLLGTEVIDAETGKVVLANSAVARIFGLPSAEDAIGITPMEYILPEDRDWVAEQMAAAFIDPGKRDVATIRSGTRDGRIVWLTATAASFEYHGRRAILVSMIDVTATREAEAKLRESEEKNRLLIENAAEAIAVIQDGATRFFNRRLTELTGCSEEELYRISLVDLVHAEDREMVALNLSRAAGISTPSNYQFRIIDRRGHTRWLQVSSVRLNWENRPATLSMFSDVTERVKAEQALRDSEERFRALIEKASDAIIIIGADASIQYYSPSIARATGYEAHDWKERSMADWRLHPDDLALVTDLLLDVLKEPGKAIENLKVRYMHEDGTWHTLEAMVRNMLHDPKINGIVANFRDITERVKAEQAVRESEERYRLLAENVSDVIWVIDMNMKPTYISPSAQRMLGYSNEQFMSGSIESMLTRESARVAIKAFSKALSRESAQPGALWDTPPLDLQFLRADGSSVWTAANFSYIRGSDGKPMAMLGVLKDISERKKAEDSLRRSEERFRSLVETSSDWVWEVDANNRYTYVSPKVRDILGHEPQDLLGRTPFEFMHQREGRRVSKIMRRFATERLPFSLLENTATHKDGRSVVLESSAVPIMDNSGRLAGYRGINRDITERKKVEQELQRSLRRLEKTMESTIEAITTTIETRDPYTTGHQMRVTDLACAIAKVMEIPPGKIEGIRVAGLLHDIGKIAVPTEILSKPGKLNEVEYEMIKTHAKIGYNILKKIEFPWPVARAVLQHHERWNGSGYPYGIRGEDILLEARILAVADVMEAMSSHRPYRPSIGADKALDEIVKNSGILYDPAVANACIAAFSESGFAFSANLPGAAADADVAPAERHIRYSLEDH